LGRSRPAEHDPSITLSSLIADRTRAVWFFHDALFITRHFRDSILTIGRKSKFRVAADGTLTKTEVGEVERRTVLIDEFGLSEEIVQALPHDLVGGRRTSWAMMPGWIEEKIHAAKMRISSSTSSRLRVEENAVGFRCSLALSAVSSFVRV
jgi:hypothetical protein